MQRGQTEPHHPSCRVAPQRVQDLRASVLIPNSTRGNGHSTAQHVHHLTDLVIDLGRRNAGGGNLREQQLPEASP